MNRRSARRRANRVGAARIRVALACDYRLMAAGDHVIGQPEILSLPPGAAESAFVRLVGTHQDQEDVRRRLIRGRGDRVRR
jgi:enoyl-CoA hydratase/carnithine racemase